MANCVAEGGTLAPLHYLNSFSLEDSLNFEYGNAAFPDSSLTHSNRRSSHVSWKLDDLESITKKHNKYPSKGHLYKRNKNRTHRVYRPFDAEDLRLRGARAWHSAVRLREQVLDHFRCFDDWDKIKKVEKDKPPIGSFTSSTFPSSQSCQLSNARTAAPATQKRDYIIDSGASVNLISRKLLSDEEWTKRKRLSVPLVLRTANSKVIATHTLLKSTSKM